MSILYDRQIREPLFDWLEAQAGVVRFLEEKTMGRSRADILMVTNDALTGIEIKSDADTYARLQRQVRDYSRWCDYNILVVGARHALHAAEHVPDWWGIVVVEQVQGRFDFYLQRAPQPNPKPHLAQKIAILWRPELARIQQRYRLPKYREKSKRFVEQKLLEKLEPDELNRAISDALFERDYTTIENEIETYRRRYR